MLLKCAYVRKCMYSCRYSVCMCMYVCACLASCTDWLGERLIEGSEGCWKYVVWWEAEEVEGFTTTTTHNHHNRNCRPPLPYPPPLNYNHHTPPLSPTPCSAVPLLPLSGTFPTHGPCLTAHNSSIIIDFSNTFSSHSTIGMWEQDQPES
jgi:hypothetical protein